MSPASWPARPADHATAADRYLALTLKDPASVQLYQLSEPGMCQMPGFGARWCACVVVNAKNSFGGYTGAQRHLLVYAGDGVHSMLPDGPFSYTAEYCGAWATQPRDPAAITASQIATSPGQAL